MCNMGCVLASLGCYSENSILYICISCTYLKHLCNLSETKIKCNFMLGLREPQNCQDWKGPQEIAQSRVNQSRFLKVVSSPVLNMSKNEDSTASLGDLKYLLFILICSLVFLFQCNFIGISYLFGNYIQRYGCSYCRCIKVSFKLSTLGSHALRKQSSLIIVVTDKVLEISPY